MSRGGAMTRARRYARAVISFITAVARHFSDDRLALSAGAISFFAFLSLIPLLLFVVSVAAYFTTVEQAERVIDATTATLGPAMAKALSRQILSVVHDRGVLTSVSLIAGLWFGSGVFGAIESAVNLAWRSRRKRPYWMRRGLAMVMTIVVGMVLVISIGFTNLLRVSRIGAIWLNQLGTSWLFTTLISFAISVLIPTLMIFAILAILYKVLPTIRVTWRAVMPGALFAAILWLITLHLFSWYVTRFANFNILYGSLGGLALLLIWFYYNAWVLLVGAEISAEYHRYLVQHGDREEREIDRAWHRQRAHGRTGSETRGR